MMTDTHHTQQDLALYAMQRLSVKQSHSIHQHLQSCSICRHDFADLCCELVLCGAAVEQRKVPFGARGRFAERLHGAESSVSTATAARVSEPATSIPGMPKKSLLPVNTPVSISNKKKPGNRSKVETIVTTTGRTLAARILGIF
jgi:hypothetical protein